MVGSQIRHRRVDFFNYHRLFLPKRAQMRSSPYWPARIELNPPKEVGKIPAGKICVFFFGSKN